MREHTSFRMIGFHRGLAAVRASASLALGVSILLAASALRLPAQDASEPLEVDKFEKERVHLVLIGTVVVDHQGRTVPGLTAEDFELIVGGGVQEIDTLDVFCDAGALEEPRGGKRAPAVEAERRIVLVVDYPHLRRLERVEVLERAMEVIEHGAAEGEEIMVAALNGGLRIEQPFTADKEKVLETLRRMEYDISLWQPDFFHLTERGFFDGVIALLDVVGTFPGSKAMVLFSRMAGGGLDSDFDLVAAAATSARCAVYPVDASRLWGVRPPRPPG